MTAFLLCAVCTLIVGTTVYFIKLAWTHITDVNEPRAKPTEEKQ